MTFKASGRGCRSRGRGRQMTLAVALFVCRTTVRVALHFVNRK